MSGITEPELLVHMEPADEQPRLRIPDGDVTSPELSIVIPALNEEITIREFVRWCHEGLDEAGIVGEILIVDSSTDRTAEIALDEGARVLSSPSRGLGRAYIDAVPYVRGRYVLMGDADCTYDFRQLRPFVERFHEGFEFVMGSRWRGSIAPGSMPALHRYVGTPITTWILNRVYSSSFSDIHCGMRGITKDALERLQLSSQSWEYASEMVLKSVHMKLRTTEVPVTFLADRNGRLSHHKRAGWFSPFQAAWINLKAMFVYGADFFVLRPGVVLLALGLLLTLPLSLGELTVGGVTLSLYTQLFGTATALLGLQSFLLGCLAQVFFDYTGEATSRWLRLFPYTRTALLAGASLLIGIACVLPLVVIFTREGFAFPKDPSPFDHLAVTGVLLVIAGFMTFTSTLVLHAAVLSRAAWRREHA